MAVRAHGFSHQFEGIRGQIKQHSCLVWRVFPEFRRWETITFLRALRFGQAGFRSDLFYMLGEWQISCSLSLVWYIWWSFLYLKLKLVSETRNFNGGNFKFGLPCWFMSFFDGYRILYSIRFLLHVATYSAICVPALQHRLQLLMDWNLQILKKNALCVVR